MSKESKDRLQLKSLLQRYWKTDSYRPGQREAVEAVLSGRDVLAVFPTGGGKSLCYQLPALAGNGLVLVVTPLIALMQDQVAGLNARGIPAAFVNSTLSARAIDQCLTDAEFGKYRLLYVAPERLETELFQARAARLHVSLLAVDEAHCVSEWARHFRPSYLRIPETRKILGDPPVMALTATATPYVRRDVAELLALKDPLILIRGFDRPNIRWSVVRTDAKKREVLQAVSRIEGSGILYASTRQRSEEWATWLNGNGEKAGAYHGGLSVRERTHIQSAWINGDLRVIVATNAFGMGIDKSNVRFVIHTDIPGSIEAFYQEAGRAGRDGDTASSMLFYHPSDLLTQKALIDESHPDAKSVRLVYEAVCNLAQIPVGFFPEQPVPVHLDSIRKITRFTTTRIRGAVEVLLKQGIWTPLFSRRHHVWVRMKQTPEQIRQYADQQPNRQLKRFLLEVLRLLPPDAYSGWWETDVNVFQKRLKLGRERVESGFSFLQERSILEWIPENAMTRVLFKDPRNARLLIDDYVIQRSRKRAETRLADMERYAESDTCRRQYLLTYFGEDAPDYCGACDFCFSSTEDETPGKDDADVLLSILENVFKKGYVPAAEEWSTVNSTRARHLVSWLLMEGYLERSAINVHRFEVTGTGKRLLEKHGRLR